MFKSKWGLWIIGFVILFSCGFCGIIGAIYKDSSTVQSISESTNKSTSKSNIDSCSVELQTYFENMQEFNGIMISYGNSLKEFDFEYAYQLLNFADNTLKSISVPTCNSDVVSMHNYVKLGIHEYFLAHNALANKDATEATYRFEKGADYFSSATRILKFINNNK